MSAQALGGPPALTLVLPQLLLTDFAPSSSLHEMFFSPFLKRIIPETPPAWLWGLAVPCGGATGAWGGP